MTAWGRSGMLTQVGDHLVYHQQSNKLRVKAILYIFRYFPSVVPELVRFAIKCRANLGDMAVLTIAEIILPALEADEEDS